MAHGAIVRGPLTTKKNGNVFDSTNTHMNMYPDTIAILENLKNEAYPLAVASRTDQPSWAKELMLLLGIEHFFDYKEIYPSSKVKHLKHIKENSGYDFHEMVFFDDEYRNIAETKGLGVNAILVKNGITSELVEMYKH